jgi:hypothetical protein
MAGPVARHSIVQDLFKLIIMKKLILIPVLVVLLATLNGFSQTPVPETDTTTTVIKEGDPAIETLPRGLDYVEDKKQITHEELPDPVKETLESDARYAEWRNATIFHEHNKDEYLVEFSKDGKTTSYRFDKEGKPIIQEE